MDCKAIEEIPDFDGPPDYDDLLTIACERHTNSLGIAHVGHLLRVPIRYWAVPKVKEQILHQIREGTGGIAEGDQDFYDTKSQFHADAMTCFQQHLSPKGQCPDYMSDKKRLVPKTAADRKEAGLAAPSKARAVHISLCRFCPVHVYNLQKEKQKVGLYT